MKLHVLYESDEERRTLARRSAHDPEAMVRYIHELIRAGHSISDIKNILKMPVTSIWDIVNDRPNDHTQDIVRIVSEVLRVDPGFADVTGPSDGQFFRAVWPINLGRGGDPTLVYEDDPRTKPNPKMWIVNVPTDTGLTSTQHVRAAHVNRNLIMSLVNLAEAIPEPRRGGQGGGPTYALDV